MQQRMQGHGVKLTHCTGLFRSAKVVKAGHMWAPILVFILSPPPPHASPTHPLSPHPTYSFSSMAKNSRAKRSSGRARSRRARVATTNESTQISANTGDVATQERSPSVGQHTPSNVHPANAATGVVEGVVEVRDRSVARKKAHLQPSNAEVVAVESYTPGHQLGPAGIATGSHATLVPSVTASPNQRGQAADMANQAGRANAGSTSTSSHVPSGRVLRSVSKRSALADQVGTSTQTVGGSTTGTTMDVAGTASAGRAALTPTQQRTSVGDRPEDGIRAPALLLMSEAAAMRDYGGPARGAIIPSELVSANHQPVGEENTAPAVDHRGRSTSSLQRGRSVLAPLRTMS
ncbi:hypothetical protein C8Q80DRAFT_180267 [Daedaleopsis nitida]|nr:hypothetical protein C8Q80DRAFT_180267 [Daedaleopsis nitida]